MEGIAKTAQPEVSPTKTEPTEAKTPISANSIDGVNLEVYRYFNINPLTDKGNEQLKTVNNWAFEEGRKLPDALMRIRSLELKLGAPSFGDTKISKMFNWVRMNNIVKTTEAKRDDAIKKIRHKYNLELNIIKSSHKYKLEKINVELARLGQEYRNASGLTRNRPLREIAEIKKEYSRQINDLKSMRNVYGGK